MKKIIYILLACVLTLHLNAQVDRSKQPSPGPSPILNLGKPKEFTLSNGLSVLMVEDHKLPRVAFSLVFDNPLHLEGELRGINELTSYMMGNGTKTMSKEEFNEALEFYGASVSFGLEGVGGLTLSKYFPEVIKLVAEGALNPLFTQEELENKKKLFLENLKGVEKDASTISGRVSNYLLFGDKHPYGEFATPESIEKITLEDVQNHYKKYFTTFKAYLIVVGDVDFEKTKKMITKRFGEWNKSAIETTIHAQPENLEMPEINFIDLPNAVQSIITVENLADFKRSSPDYFAAILANSILGAGGQGRLFENLREAHGWTYGAYSGLTADKHIGNFKAMTQVRNAVTDSAVVEMLNEIEKIRNTLPSQKELETIKAYLTGQFVMSAEKPLTTAQWALNERTEGLSPDFYKDYLKNLNAVTPEQVQAAAQKYISRYRTRIVIVGKSSEVLGGLKKLGIPIKYYDKYGKLLDAYSEEIDAK